LSQPAAAQRPFRRQMPSRRTLQHPGPSFVSGTIAKDRHYKPQLAIAAARPAGSPRGNLGPFVPAIGGPATLTIGSRWPG